MGKECDKDYFLEFFEGEALAQIKKDLNIPDDMPDHAEGWIDEETEVKFRTDEPHDGLLGEYGLKPGECWECGRINCCGQCGH